MPVQRAGDIVLRDYQIEAFIGEGGFGEVYRARQVHLNQLFALKILPRAGMSPAGYAAAEIRFRKEAQLGVRVNHPAIVRVFGFSLDEGRDQLVLVMAYAAGGSLRQALDERRERQQPYSITDALRIGQGIAAGLAALHAENVIHRDLSPNNILFDSAGAPLIADLGLAQTAEAPSLGRGDSDQPPPHPGTPGYRSPEHADGYNLLKPPADVYALGLLLFEMLTLKQYGSCRPGTRMSMLRPDVPVAVDELLVKMLSEDPRQRPWDGAAVEKALDKLVKTAPSRTPPDRKPTPGSVWARALLIVGAVALLVGLGLGVGQSMDWLPSTAVNTPPTVVGPFSTPVPTPTSTPTPTITPTTIPLVLPTKTVPPTPTQTFPAAADPNIPPACTDPGQEWTSPIDGMTLVCVPAGDFLMGSPDVDGNADADEKPQHTVYLNAYWMDQTEVTNAMFAKFVAAIGYRTTAENEGSGWAYTGGTWTTVAGANWQHPSGPGSDLTGREAYPVVQVSWDDAVAYCEWVGRQLPSEAQWEKAARGNGGQTYPWGNLNPVGNLVNFADRNTNFDWSDKTIDDGFADTAPVGSYPAGVSPYGTLDMAGNVWEWTADWYDRNYYPSQTTWHDPAGPISGEYRVVRGGSWINYARGVRSAFRTKEAPAVHSNYLGFRCLLIAAP
jgi:serine/threonine-protein kinase